MPSSSPIGRRLPVAVNTRCRPAAAGRERPPRESLIKSFASPGPDDRPALHPITENEPPQDVPVALLLILGAVAHQRHLAPSRESPHQAQRKLLAMVLNGSAALVDRAIKEKPLSILL
jgi:hypothetical protein